METSVNILRLLTPRTRDQDSQLRTSTPPHPPTLPPLPPYTHTTQISHSHSLRTDDATKNTASANISGRTLSGGDPHSRGCALPNKPQCSVSMVTSAPGEASQKALTMPQARARAALLLFALIALPRCDQRARTHKTTHAISVSRRREDDGARSYSNAASTLGSDSWEG